MVDYKRALISVSDKKGIVNLASVLVEHNIEILSTGGTAAHLDSEGIPATKISDYTDFPEILDGRVKTLHPYIHGGLLADRSKDKHLSELEKHGIKPIDIVVTNLYPFEDVIKTASTSHDEKIENIDIGGVTLLRSAAKNYSDVVVLQDRSDYSVLINSLSRNESLGEDIRFYLALKAFRKTAWYDTVIQKHFRQFFDDKWNLPEKYFEGYRKVQDLRYGENPHQEEAALYEDLEYEGSSVVDTEKLQGKELSFNNMLDFDSAWNLVNEFNSTACAVMKHTNPCGCAVAKTPLEAHKKARSCDPVSAFGSVIGFNTEVDAETAREITDYFVEGVIAPAYTEPALEVFEEKKKLRILLPEETKHSEGNYDLKKLRGGLLVQEADEVDLIEEDLEVVTEREPTGEEMKALRFAWKVVKHVKSNAIVYADSTKTLGIGAGQMSRVDSSELAVKKAEKSNIDLEGSVLASDAFFPFRDGVDAAAEAGVRAIIEPGGSIRDDEVIEAANEHDVAMVFTDIRHFRH